MNEGGPTKKIMLTGLEGKRNAGRPRLRYMDGVDFASRAHIEIRNWRRVAKGETNGLI